MFTHMDLHSFIPQSSAITAADTNCTTSFVRVQDGDDSDAPVVGSYCLTRVPSPITSQVYYFSIVLTELSLKSDLIQSGFFTVRPFADHAFNVIRRWISCHILYLVSRFERVD